ncbi:MAG: hypothetical protein KC493_01510 [Bacteriovoracaceae bacterium]|nr:hypothetical protein [Bacteriovoracaceae bacterium]
MKTLTLLIILLGYSSNAFSGGYFTVKDGVISMVPEERTHKIKDFSTDGCSSFPDGFIPTQSTEWLDCCIMHDVDYWVGGEEHLKDKADEELGYCVANVSNSLLGLSMDLGVQVGGVPSPMSWRWGYGWDAIIGYNPLDTKQLTSAASKYDTVIDAIISEKELLDGDQKLRIKEKLHMKLVELLPYLGKDEKSKEAEYDRLLERIYQSFK